MVSGMSLYQIRNAGSGYIVKKFDDMINHQEDYRLTFKGKNILCSCGAWSYDGSCRHRKMLPIFELERAIDTARLYDYDKGKWVENHDAT